MDKHEENARQYQAMHKNLKSLREKNNWSVEELSQHSGIAIETLIDIEHEKDFEIEALFTLCQIYGIKIHEIFTLF